jgi:8-hydroxy-5-deazaflavin:NADPH oxidoreductase
VPPDASNPSGSPEPQTPVQGPVAIVGASGALGFGLALRLGRAGVPVVIGSRSPERALEAVARALGAVPGGSFSGCDNAEAVARAETVILSVPFRSQSETLANLREALRQGQLLIDASVPLAAAVSGRATRMLGVWQGSAAQQAREMAPDGVRVVSALHTVGAASLADLRHELAEDVLVCGDARADKRDAATLIERIEGLRCVDCGRLEMARVTESLTAMLIAVNARYKVRAGVRLTGLPDRLWE